MKYILFALLRPLLEIYIRLRFHDYWGLKDHLCRRPNRLLKHCYDRHFSDLGSFVGVHSKFGGRPYFPHGCRGIFISDNAVIGKDAIIFQQVTIGSNTLPDTKTPGSPVIGDGAYLGAGCKIIGGITLGDCCRVGANAVVYRDMPSHSVAVCAPTRVIQKENLDNTFRMENQGLHFITRDGSLVPEKDH